MAIQLTKFKPNKGKKYNVYSNGERAARGAEMIALHPDSNLPSHPCRKRSSGDCDNAADCIADILHWLHREGQQQNISNVMRRAEMHYWQEK